MLHPLTTHTPSQALSCTVSDGMMSPSQKKGFFYLYKSSTTSKANFRLHTLCNMGVVLNADLHQRQIIPRYELPTTTSVCFNTLRSHHFLHNSPSRTLPPPARWKKETFLTCRKFPSWKKEKGKQFSLQICLSQLLYEYESQPCWNSLRVSLVRSKVGVSMLRQEALQASRP